MTRERFEPGEQPENGVDALVVEITFTAYAQDRTGRVVGGNVADATLGFAVRTDPIPANVTDAQVMAALARGMSTLLAGVADTMAHMGYVALGQVKDPVNGHAIPTGRSFVAPPASVVHPAPGDSGRPS